VGSRLLWAQISRSISNGRSTILVMVVVLLDGTRMMSGSGVRLWGDATRAVEDPKTLHFHPSDMILATQQEQAYIYMHVGC
jgi:hypothetical protein